MRYRWTCPHCGRENTGFDTKMTTVSTGRSSGNLRSAFSHSGGNDGN